jgi:hypothetical protein
MRVSFVDSDMSWLVFVSEPTEFECASWLSPATAYDPGNAVQVIGLGGFDLRATKPMDKGMVRVVMGNNCTTGHYNRINCDMGSPVRDNTEFEHMLRRHADVYPTGKADIWFALPPNTKDEDMMRLNFNWAPALMSRIKELGESELPENDLPAEAAQLLMYASPHHQDRMRSISESPNEVQTVGCTRLLHGIACPVIGSQWSLLEHLHHVGFSAQRPVRSEMLDVVRAAAQEDILFELPDNYMRGAGDTYFSGKMLAKLARIIVIADEVRRPSWTSPLALLYFPRPYRLAIHRSAFLASLSVHLFA